MGIGFMKHSRVPYVMVSVSAQTGGSALGGGKYIKRRPVTVTASVNSGYTFGGWYSGGVRVSGDLVYTFTAVGDIALEARFIAMVTVTVTAQTGGTANGGGTVASGTSITVTASPSSSHNFAGWYEGNTLVSSSVNYTFAATSNRTLQARFTIKTYTITATATLGTASGGGTVNHGGSVTLTSAPAGSNIWVGWYEGGTLVSTNRTLTLTNITYSRILEARFRAPVVGEPGTVGDQVNVWGRNDGKGSATWTFTHGKPAYIEILSIYQYVDYFNSSPECYDLRSNHGGKLAYGTTKLTINCNISYPYGSLASKNRDTTFTFEWTETSVIFRGLRPDNQYDTRNIVFIPHY